jgi:hypothetical protein
MESFRKIKAIEVTSVSSILQEEQRSEETGVLIKFTKSCTRLGSWGWRGHGGKVWIYVEETVIAICSILVMVQYPRSNLK